MFICRETYEETGLKCKFVEMIGFREINKFYFDLNELFFIGRLELENEN